MRTLVNYQDGGLIIRLISKIDCSGDFIYEIQKLENGNMILFGWTKDLREAMETVNKVIDLACLEN